MRQLKLATVVLTAVLAFGAISAANALALPEFVGAKSEVAFTSTSGTSVLSGEELGIPATITCEKDETSGTILNHSMLVDKVVAKFFGKCHQSINGGEPTTCEEPITTSAMMGELGYIKEKAKPVGLLLKPESGSVFATTKCGSTETVVEGEIVGEFPEINKALVNQYNKSLTKFELVFKASGTKQAVTTLELLTGFMTGIHLSVSGFFGGEASQSDTESITAAEAGEIKA
jgi:hypothetical protein